MDPNDPSVLRILVATDNHLGYLEKDPVRGNDSFDAFEQILQYGQEYNVDMMVLGGDLFHDNKPSRKTLHTAMELFRHYCFGDRVSELEFLSDPSVNFHSRFARPNYLDPNLNVQIPVFAIHGNHDDPAGDGNLSAMDLLSVGGFLNYFGRQKEVDDIQVSPIILRKGTTNLALYGIGNIRDERLYRTFTSKKVSMLRPVEATSNPEHWFNLMLFHQNRAAYSPKNHIPELFLDDFLDLIVWGHEHDCLVDPTYYPQRDFYISQPGSSCVTSLSEGESGMKHVALLLVKGNQFELKPLPLKRNRPFVFGDYLIDAQMAEKQLLADIQRRIEEMIAKAHAQWSEHNSSECPLPLIRLRIDSALIQSKIPAFSPHRFGQLFAQKVANPRDLVYLMTKRRQAAMGPSGGRTQINIPDESIDSASTTSSSTVRRVEDLISEFLGAQRLDLLAQNEFNDTMKWFVEKDDKDAIENFLKQSLDRTVQRLKDCGLEDLRAEIGKVRIEREHEWQTTQGGVDRARLVNQSADPDNIEQQDENTQNTKASSEKIQETPAKATRGRGKRATPLALSSAPGTPVVAETPPVAKRSRWPSSKK